MKRVLFGSVLFLFCLSQNLFAQTSTYGKEFAVVDVLSVNQIVENPEAYLDNPNLIVRGEIHEVCQNAGCWIRIKSDNNNNLFVKFGDHDFTVPIDMTGPVVVHGYLQKVEVSVEELKHLAQDAGKSKQEIEAIKSPSVEYRFIADGLTVL